jgi:hypothetical protein
MAAGVMNGVQAYTAGETGRLWDPDHGVTLATITVSVPTIASADSQGDVPQYGYFLTFTVTVTNVAPASSGLTIDPSDTDFFVEVAGNRYGFGQTDLGHTPKAEPADALGTGLPSSGLGPGQSTTGTVVVDAPSVHGLLAYAPDSTPLGTWSY